MYESCSQCDSSVDATMNQQPFCEEHAREHLKELRAKLDVVATELEAAEKEYERLKDKYNIEGYGHIEHQFTVEERDDINEEDVQAVSEAEDQLVQKRQELKSIEGNIQQLEKRPVDQTSTLLSVLELDLGL